MIGARGARVFPARAGNVVGADSPGRSGQEICAAIGGALRLHRRKQAEEAGLPASSLFYCADAISAAKWPVPMIGIVIDAGWAASCKMVTWE